MASNKLRWAAACREADSSAGQRRKGIGGREIPFAKNTERWGTRCTFQSAGSFGRSTSGWFVLNGKSKGSDGCRAAGVTDESWRGLAVGQDNHFVGRVHASRLVGVVGYLDGEVHGDGGLGLDRAAMLQVGLEAPLQDGLAGSGA